MADKIEEPVKGGSTWELWKTVVQLVRAVNALNNLQVTPKSAGKFTYSDGNVSLDLQTKQCPPT
jgi:hypothetical protein